MTKWSKYILYTGVLLGFIVGGIAVYAALDHNPQKQFTENPLDLIPIFLGNAGAVSFPFTLIAVLMGVMFKEKPEKKEEIESMNYSCRKV